MSRRPAPDWDAIEREFRAGQLSVSEIARQHGISRTAVNKHAARHGWVRDLSARVRQAVSARLVAGPVSSDEAQVAGFNVATAVDAAAARAVELVRQHRAALKTGRSLVLSMIDELAEASAQRNALVEAIEMETAGDIDGRRRTAMLRAVSLPSRAATVRDLATALRNLIGRLISTPISRRPASRMAARPPSSALPPAAPAR
jgi:transposase-like protein